MVKDKEINSITTVPNKDDSWYILTNHYNLQTFLFTGMIHPYSLYTSDYYKDSFEQYPNCVPVYPNEVPKTVIDSAKADNTIPVILKIDLTKITAKIHFISKNNELVASTLHAQDKSDALLLLLPFVVSIELIDKIIFESAANISKFHSELAQNGNTPNKWAISRCEKKPNFFKIPKKDRNTSDLLKPRTNEVINATKKISSYKASGCAGLVSFTYLLANLSEEFLQIFNDIVTRKNQPNGDHPVDYIISWLDEETSKPPLFVKLMNNLVQVNYERKGKKFDHHSLTAAVLKKEVDSKGDKDPNLESFLNDFSNLRNPNGLSLEEYFSKYTRPQHRAMIIFSLCDNIDDMLSRQSEFESLEKFELVMTIATCLMGVMTGWMGIESDTKEIPELSTFCNQMIADVTNRINGSDIQRASPLNAPRPLISFLTDEQLKVKKNTNMAIDLAKQQGWNNCVKTIISLPKGTCNINGANYIYTGFFDKLVKYDVKGDELRNQIKSVFPLSSSDQSECLNKIL